METGKGDWWVALVIEFAIQVVCVFPLPKFVCVFEVPTLMASSVRL